MKEKYKVGKLVYDGEIYDGMNTDIAELLFYSQWLNKRKAGNNLELCCGTGRLTIPLAKEGFNITGVDINETMLKQAERKANEANVNVRFIEADIRSLNLPEVYDIIFIPFNSIHHLYTNQDFFKVLTGIKSYLKEDGYFIFDCFNPDIHYIVDSENKEKIIAEYSTKDGRKVVIKQTMVYENKTQINRIKWHYFINGEFDSIQNLDMRMFFPKELDEYLTTCGFESFINSVDLRKKYLKTDHRSKYLSVRKLATGNKFTHHVRNIVEDEMNAEGN